MGTVALPRTDWKVTHALWALARSPLATVWWRVTRWVTVAYAAESTALRPSSAASSPPGAVPLIAGRAVEPAQLHAVSDPQWHRDDVPGRANLTERSLGCAHGGRSGRSGTKSCRVGRDDLIERPWRSSRSRLQELLRTRPSASCSPLPAAPTPRLPYGAPQARTRLHEVGDQTLDGLAVDRPILAAQRVQARAELPDVARDREPAAGARRSTSARWWRSSCSRSWSRSASVSRSRVRYLAASRLNRRPDSSRSLVSGAVPSGVPSGVLSGAVAPSTASGEVSGEVAVLASMSDMIALAT